MSSSPQAVFKVVVTGPFSAGKTTFIETVVDREFMTTGADTTSTSEIQTKRTTTIGMDFGVLTLSDEDGDIELRIYGTPGQERFSFMWELLADGADAYILMVNGDDPATWLAAHQHHAVMERAAIPGVIAVNRGTPEDAARAGEYFGDLGLPVLACQATAIEDVKAVLVEALLEILRELERGDENDDLHDHLHDDIHEPIEPGAVW